MGVVVLVSTMAGSVTPICNRCGVTLCYDVDEDEYDDDQEFWDGWVCESCNGGTPMSLKTWRNEGRGR